MRLHLVSASSQVARIQASPSASLEYISTGSASTISSLLTFFPKCFSSFLHSTCSLSVSHIYLALEEVYLPLGAPVSKYTTLRRLARFHPTLQTGLSPSLAALSEALLRQTRLGRPSSDYNSPSKDGDYHSGLFPLRSPLLRES